MAAFRRGLELGADLLELDVQRTRDGHVVVIHDTTVDRTTDGHGRVAEMTLEALRALDAGAWFGSAFVGERVPTLDELAAWARGRIRLNIELKGAPDAIGDLPEQVADICRRRGIAAETLCISFDHIALRRLKERAPEIAGAICFNARLADPVGAARAARAEVLNMSGTFITADLCALAHGAGLGVQCYCDDPVRAKGPDRRRRGHLRHGPPGPDQGRGARGIGAGRRPTGNGASDARRAGRPDSHVRADGPRPQAPGEGRPGGVRSMAPSPRSPGATAISHATLPFARADG